MSNRSLIWIGMTAGSFIGGLIPNLWSAAPFSFSSVIFTAIGGFTGIWLAFRFNS